jgi:UDP-N-acetylglucosamine 2-epimerase (non-hydrolysing)
VEEIRIVIARGTRPEVTKTQSVITALEAAGAEVLIWDSAQSPDLTGANSRGIIWGDGLVRGIAGALPSFRDWLRAQQPVAAVLVQGDTATAFACALTAFLEGVPVGHIEAGLRTYAAEPFPEEAFRRMIAALARWHFCPDERAAENLMNERGWSGYSAYLSELQQHEGVFVTGNPLIDTLPAKPLKLLVTLHRRENWGDRISDALLTIDRFAYASGACVTVIRHPNWRQALQIDFESLRTVFVSEPVSHERLLEWLEESDLVVTDSGGLQEEAAHYGVPCLVLRSATERTALEACGAVKVIDPDREEELLEALQAEARKRTCYGDGTAGEQIATILLKELQENPEEEEAA